MAKELGSRTPLSIAVLERGAPRGSAEYLAGMDELDYAVLFKMMQDVSQQTVTLRHNAQKRAFPIREYGSFLPGSGTGGAGEHWNGTCHRPLPDVFEIFTENEGRYGEKRLPEDHSIQDWGITFSDLEPYYARVDALLGVSGKAGNLRGKLIAGGNPFEGPRSTRISHAPADAPRIFRAVSEKRRSLWDTTLTSSPPQPSARPTRIPMESSVPPARIADSASASAA